ncbi:hypothetical protein L1987_25047 [Smallanthus sonchifolius]|uniref:Uncharacterized protein n=1 Tax=Smallanthus sonchifolius TaxID=185202 RepID=A0ACB9ILE1_9ASTR|nr:hypothetical protein L1987_25047 [Smallanthus sonchifolius]
MADGVAGLGVCGIISACVAVAKVASSMTGIELIDVVVPMRKCTECDTTFTAGLIGTQTVGNDGLTGLVLFDVV